MTTGKLKTLTSHSKDQSSTYIFVYQMGRLCGGAHEISGIKAPIFLCGWVGGGGGVGWVGVGWVVVRWVGVVGWWWVGVGWWWGGGGWW